ncbi:hypothetical protein [Pandoraea sputorum]
MEQVTTRRWFVAKRFAAAVFVLGFATFVYLIFAPWLTDIMEQHLLDVLANRGR